MSSQPLSAKGLRNPGLFAISIPIALVVGGVFVAAAFQKDKEMKEAVLQDQILQNAQNRQPMTGKTSGFFSQKNDMVRSAVSTNHFQVCTACQ